MATQTGNIKITGTIDNLCFYKMNGQFYVRTKSSLTAKRVKQSPQFKLTRVYAGLMGQASKIASLIYKELPRNFRRFWMYRAFTGEAFQLLKAGNTIEETTQLLWHTYILVWEQKKAAKQNRQPAKRSSQDYINRPFKLKTSASQKSMIIPRYNKLFIQPHKIRLRIKRKPATRWRKIKDQCR
jgi:hypothetical protein